MTVPKKIYELVERFKDNLDAYKSGRYNETQVRREFIDPFFKTLGWDIDNEKGYAEAYKDVIHEDSLKIGGSIKTPDYCFRIGGTRKFFLEAKKPSINIKDNIHPAYQLRRYAWSAKLPLSILTDFEEFAVYDCISRPKQNDKPSKERILYITFDEYINRWNEIADIFSPDAIRNGSFDKYLESNKKKRGTQEVDTEFLSEIERWRKLLARNIALRNPDITQRELNYVVQATIDRIIFLRICEDRRIENYGHLKKLLNNENIYQSLCDHFRYADDRFNSGLFHFKEEKDRPGTNDRLSLTLIIDNRVLKEIIDHLYYPNSPYEFSVISANILGQIYEQFLGKVIRLTDEHRAVIEEKPEVKKAGGVYYTPTYIVEYIVEQTLVKHLKEKTAKQASKIKIIDPACGSGSFLIVAYQYMLNWYLNWYINDNPDKHKKAIYKGQNGEWRLSTDERRKILLNNIFGVDIDSQAVEVTKLSLLLKLLEGETNDSLCYQLELLHTRALPDLNQNIKCGNSLIKTDIYQYQQIGLLDDNEQYRINAFDWEIEFKNIFNNQLSGFSIVIGNPPYIFTREQITKIQREYFSNNYEATWEKQNTFMLFMELMLRILNKKGKGGFIVPNSWLTIESGHLLRKLFIPHLEIIADLNYRVFEKASMEPCIFIITGNKLDTPVLVMRTESKIKFNDINLSKIARHNWSRNDHRIVFSKSDQSTDVINKVVNESACIGDIFDVRTGLQAYEKGKGKPKQTAQDVKNHVFDRDEWEDENSYEYLQGRDIGRYIINWSGMWMQYGRWLSQPREIGIFTRPRVLLREITSNFPCCLYAAFTTDSYLNNKSVLNVLHEQDKEDELKCLVGILNSKLISLFYKQRAVKSARKLFPKVVIKNLREFPYPMEINEQIKKVLIQLIDIVIDLNIQINSTKINHDKKTLQRKLVNVNYQMDHSVYKLYELTENEIKILEDYGA